MAAPARGPVRSSARLSNGVGPAGGGSAAGSGEGARRVRDAAAAAAAAQRRARAAERLREVEDSPRVLRDKCRRLARALRNAKHLVVYTGAGISTAADIPDYRGPRGVWTRLQRGESVGRVEVSRAQPTFTHMALTALWARGTLKFVVSQNCDGLHVRGGLPRRALAELHGNMFAERCAACRRVYLRAFDTTERTARHAHGTRRLCHACGAELADTIVHFGERGRAAWPLNWAGALRHAAVADVVLCLGSSLKVLRRYPRLWRMHAAPGQRPQLYIVNLQWTPKDSVAKLKINARCDAVMAQVARRLRLRVPRYRPQGDPLLAHAEPLAPPEAHTTRRPLLTPPPPAGSDGPSSDDSDRDSDSDESDDELPLRRLAERLRGAGGGAAAPAPPAPLPPPAPAPAPRVPPLPPPPGLLHAFQVSMNSGDATILLRAEHAPSAGDARPPSRLRLFRRMRPAHLDHPAPPYRGQSFVDEKNNSVKFKQTTECKDEPVEFKEKMDTKDFDFKDEKVESEKKPWPKEEPPDPPRAPNGVHGPAAAAAAAAAGRRARSADAVSALAAAIIARAVLLCRGELYPGLHSIIVPAPPPAATGAAGAAGATATGTGAGAGAECAWCLRRLAARRCLWYGAAACTPPERRAWRRVRARRFLCACCGPGAAAAPDPDTGGWYGKGYRKGRRRRRGR